MSIFHQAFSGSRYRFALAVSALVFACAGLASNPSSAASALGMGAPGLGSVPPALLDQLRNMPPEEAQRLAAQYGIDLGAFGLNGSMQQELGRPGEFVQPAYPLDLFGDLEVDEEDARSDAERERIEPLDPGERYGLDFFRASVSTFAPVDNAPVPADYVLGPGDSLDVFMLGRQAGSLYLEIDRAGEIAFPEIGKIALAGLRFSEAAQLLRERVAAQLIGVDVSVGIGRLRAINVMVAGEVRVPGARSLSAFARVTHALFASGGVTDIGSLRDVRIMRAGEIVANFDAYDLLLAGDASNDVTLRDGDVVFVPPVRKLARVSGLVRRPAVYELDEQTSLSALVEMAGGLTARALVREGLLERQRSDGVPEIVPLALASTSLTSVVAQDGDHLRIQPAADRFGNGLRLRGAVQRPGIYGFREGMRVSDLIRNPAADLSLDVDYEYALIVSTDSGTGRIDVRQFRVREVLQAPGGLGDPPLKPRDELIFFYTTAAIAIHEQERAKEAQAEEDARRMESGEATDAESAEAEDDRGRVAQRNGDRADRTDRRDRENTDSSVDGMEFADADQDRQNDEDRFQPASRQELLAPVVARLEAQASPDAPVRVVGVSGAVHAPGDYPLGEGDTVEDLIAAAGGLRGDAFTRELELQRVITDTEGVASIRTFRIGVGVGAENGTDFVLSSRDRLMVRAVPDWRPDDIVEITGELRFPGEYRIAPGETLGQLIARAGGLTRDGFAEGAVFTRASVAEREERETDRFIRELRRSAAASTLTREQVSVDIAGLEELVDSLRSSSARGRMVIDLPRVLVGDSASDFTLQDGDAIHIPPVTRTVTVVGEVQHPGTFRYQQSFDVDDYLSLGAGTTRRADERRMYILHANGEITRIAQRDWLRFDLGEAGVRPGDTIIVPIDTSYRDTLEYWKSITQIVYQTGIAIAAVLSISNN